MTTYKFFLLIQILLISTQLAVADWEFYEKTNLKGTISGTVQKDRIFETTSGSIYQVSDLTLQLVLELMPDTTVLRDGERFKLIVKGFDEPLICKLLRPPGNGSGSGAASTSATNATKPHATREIPLEKLIPEDMQKEMGLQKLSREEKEKLRQHVYNLCSAAFEQGMKQGTNVASSRSTDTKTPAVIESQLDGESEGFAGETIFQLANGQLWQQSRYYYRYRYAYRPKVIIFDDGSGYKIKIDGIDEAVSVRRLK